MLRIQQYRGNISEGAALLLQQHRRSAHHQDPPPVPDHDDEDAGSEEGLHRKPHFGEASVLVDALGEEKRNQSQILAF